MKQLRFAIGSALATLLAVQPVLAATAERRLWDERREAAARRAGPAVLLASAGLPPASRATAPASIDRILASGSVRSTANAGPERRRTLVLVNDVHLNAEAQEGIRRAVSDLLDAGAISFVALEGAAGNVDLSIRNRRVPPPALRLAADHLLSTGRISGAVHALLTSSGPAVPAVGVEQPDLYRRNVEAAVMSRRSMSAASARIDRLAAKAEERASTSFNDRLSGFRRRLGTNRGGLPSAESAALLLAATPDARGRFPNLAMFGDAVALEKRFDAARVEADRARLMAALAPRLSDGETRDLLRAAVGFRSGSVSQSRLFSVIAEHARRHAIALGSFDALHSHIEYLRLVEAIDGGRLIEEAAEAERRALDSLAESREERALLLEIARIRLARRLATLSLTRTEWSAWLKAAPLPGVDLSGPEAFYRLALERDEAIVSSVERLLEGGSGVLVAGGFHGPGIERALAGRDVRVVRFTPRLTRDPGARDAYFTAFTIEKTPLDRLLDGERIFLALPPARIGALPEMLLLAEEAADPARPLPDPAGRLAELRGQNHRLDVATRDIRAGESEATSGAWRLSARFEPDGRWISFELDQTAGTRWAPDEEFFRTFRPLEFLSAHHGTLAQRVVRALGVALIWGAMMAVPLVVAPALTDARAAAGLAAVACAQIAAAVTAALHQPRRRPSARDRILLFPIYPANVAAHALHNLVFPFARLALPAFDGEWVPGRYRRSVDDVRSMVRGLAKNVRSGRNDIVLARSHRLIVDILDAVGLLPRRGEGTVVNLLDGGNRLVGLDRDVIGIDARDPPIFQAIETLEYVFETPDAADRLEGYRFVRQNIDLVEAVIGAIRTQPAPYVLYLSHVHYFYVWWKKEWGSPHDEAEADFAAILTTIVREITPRVIIATEWQVRGEPTVYRRLLPALGYREALGDVLPSRRTRRHFEAHAFDTVFFPVTKGFNIGLGGALEVYLPAGFRLPPRPGPDASLVAPSTRRAVENRGGSPGRGASEWKLRLLLAPDLEFLQTFRPLAFLRAHDGSALQQAVRAAGIAAIWVAMLAAPVAAAALFSDPAFRQLTLILGYGQLAGSLALAHVDTRIRIPAELKASLFLVYIPNVVAHALYNLAARFAPLTRRATRDEVAPPDPGLEVSVVVPVYAELDNGNVASLLRSLTRQTAPPSSFEVILVVNNAAGKSADPDARAENQRLLELGPYLSGRSAEPPASVWNDLAPDVRLDFEATVSAGLRVRLLDRSTRGVPKKMGAIRNAGVALAVDRLVSLGRPDGFVANLDADTTVPPGWIDGLRAHRRSGAGVVHSGLRLRYGGGGKDLFRSFHLEVLRLLGHQMSELLYPEGTFFVGGPQIAARADVWRESGAFDDGIDAGEDADFAWRVRGRPDLVYDPALYVESQDRARPGGYDARRRLEALAAPETSSGFHPRERRYPRFEILIRLLRGIGPRADRRVREAFAFLGTPFDPRVWRASAADAGPGELPYDRVESYVRRMGWPVFGPLADGIMDFVTHVLEPASPDEAAVFRAWADDALRREEASRETLRGEVARAARTQDPSPSASRLSHGQAEILGEAWFRELVAAARRDGGPDRAVRAAEAALPEWLGPVGAHQPRVDAATLMPFITFIRAGLHFPSAFPSWNRILSRLTGRAWPSLETSMEAPTESALVNDGTRAAFEARATARGGARSEWALRLLFAPDLEFLQTFRPFRFLASHEGTRAQQAARAVGIAAIWLAMLAAPVAAAAFVPDPVFRGLVVFLGYVQIAGAAAFARIDTRIRLPIDIKAGLFLAYLPNVAAHALYNLVAAWAPLNAKAAREAADIARSAFHEELSRLRAAFEGPRGAERAERTLAHLWLMPRPKKDPGLQRWRAALAEAVTEVIRRDVTLNEHRTLQDIRMRARASVDPKFRRNDMSTAGRQNLVLPDERDAKYFINEVRPGGIAINMVSFSGADSSAVRLVYDVQDGVMLIMEIQREGGRMPVPPDAVLRLLERTVEAARRGGLRSVRIITAGEAVDRFSHIPSHAAQANYARLPWQAGFRLADTDPMPVTWGTLMPSSPVLWELVIPPATPRPAPETPAQRIRRELEAVEGLFFYPAGGSDWKPFRFLLPRMPGVKVAVYGDREYHDWQPTLPFFKEERAFNLLTREGFFVRQLPGNRPPTRALVSDDERGRTWRIELHKMDAVTGSAADLMNPQRLARYGGIGFIHVERPGEGAWLARGETSAPFHARLIAQLNVGGLLGGYRRPAEEPLEFLQGSYGAIGIERLGRDDDGSIYLKKIRQVDESEIARLVRLDRRIQDLFRRVEFPFTFNWSGFHQKELERAMAELSAYPDAAHFVRGKFAEAAAELKRKRGWDFDPFALHVRFVATAFVLALGAADPSLLQTAAFHVAFVATLAFEAAAPAAAWIVRRSRTATIERRARLLVRAARALTSAGGPVDAALLDDLLRDAARSERIGLRSLRSGEGSWADALSDPAFPALIDRALTREAGGAIDPSAARLLTETLSDWGVTADAAGTRPNVVVQVRSREDLRRLAALADRFPGSPISLWCAAGDRRAIDGIPLPWPVIFHDDALFADPRTLMLAEVPGNLPADLRGNPGNLVLALADGVRIDDTGVDPGSEWRRARVVAIDGILGTLRMMTVGQRAIVDRIVEHLVASRQA